MFFQSNMRILHIKVYVFNAKRGFNEGFGYEKQEEKPFLGQISTTFLLKVMKNFNKKLCCIDVYGLACVETTAFNTICDKMADFFTYTEEGVSNVGDI